MQSMSSVSSDASPPNGQTPVGSSTLELQLRAGMDTEGTLYRVSKGDTLRLVLHHSLVGVGQQLQLETNHPAGAETPFSRSAWRRLDFVSPHPLDAFDAYAELSVCQAGCFELRFARDRREPAGRVYFVVEPQLPLDIPLDGLTIQTYLSKSLGPLAEWQSRLRVAADTGYNMVHFTPLQELGYSGSAYSLRDQLSPNPLFKADWSAIGDQIVRLQQELGLLSMADLVYNHTSNDTRWLQEHPECAHNLLNSKHLRPAYVVDRVIAHWTEDVAAGAFVDDGLTPDVSCEEDLQKAKVKLESSLRRFRVHEFYLCHVDNVLSEFREFLASRCPPPQQLEELEAKQLTLVQDPEYRRLGCSVRMDLAAKYHWLPLRHRPDAIDAACAGLRGHLEFLNTGKFDEASSHLAAAVDNALAGARYRFVAEHGEHLGRVGPDTPLVWNYFLHPWPEVGLDDCESAMDDADKAARVMAHNGWVMNDDPLRNFAEQVDCNVFLRRELIVWGDSVKLRYGRGRDDCPYLWDLMAKYTERTAKVFHAVRLDNCHSTPLHVAQYMLDRARAVRPDLYVTGELFTGSEHVDNIFINKLGISSCIREAQSAWCPYDLGRQVYRYGGPPVGDLQREPNHPLCPAVAGALLFDATHDNRSAVESRSAHDLLPTSALVGMAACATGSNRGYDELVPHHIHVVHETRPYQTVDQVAQCPAITVGKKLINNLHLHLASEGFTEQFVDQVTDSVVAVTRHNPQDHQRVILVSHTAFTEPPAAEAPPHVPPLPVSGKIDEITFEITFGRDADGEPFRRDPNVINGLADCSLELQEHVPLDKSRLVSFKEGSVHFRKFPPGSVVALRVHLDRTAERACFSLKKTLVSGKSPETNLALGGAVDSLGLSQLSFLLFRCGAEEAGGVYTLPGYGDLVYCGIHGLGRLLRRVTVGKDLGHPVCANLRAGDWLADYVLARLRRHPFSQQLHLWLSEYVKVMRCVPRYLVPLYFGSAVLRLHEALLARARSLLFGQQPASRLLFALGLGSLQFVGDVADSRLPALADAVAKELPSGVSLAAGFPHFAHGLFRSWGRDTFISLRGLLLLTGRWPEARAIILAFAGALRHGLIPNLCGDGLSARYNCRDAMWYWLHCVCEFASSAPRGERLLLDPVRRLYPSDEPGAAVAEQPLHAVVQEALQRHADGIDFVERNAGPGIDEHMRPEGFRVRAGLRYPFVSGGSRWNCGTWMDKMGSSGRAGNRGHPATPRHGCAVELSGLCAAVVRSLSELHAAGHFPHDGVSLPDGRRLSWRQWWSDLREQFEAAYHLPDEGYYRDCIDGDETAGRQFRPNFLVTMAVAPELFGADKARRALALVRDRLLGPIGIKTLASDDPQYRPYYDNDNDSEDFSVAKGFSYHNGPEWVWPVGYYLRACLLFADDRPAAVRHVQRTLARYQQVLEESDWHSLPELTNADGQHCRFGCPAQAWSVATLFEAACDLRNFKE